MNIKMDVNPKKRMHESSEVVKRHSVGEQVVASHLDESGITYLYDASLKDLKGVKNGPLRFDFVIPYSQKEDTQSILNGTNTNFAVVEYNGIYHYHLIQGRTSKYTLCKQQFNDYLKHIYCQHKQIPILWIPYWTHLTNVKQDLDEFLNTLPITKNTE
mgnify:CR=1 FL=1